MNRHERRRQKAMGKKFGAGDVLRLKYGRVVYADPSIVNQCFACDGPAGEWPWVTDRPKDAPSSRAHGTININDEVDQPICETCFGSEERGDQIARKMFNSPMLKIENGGEASDQEVREIVTALMEAGEATAH